MRGIIFDLDQTLIDTKSVKSLREKRQWTSIYSRLDSLKPYHGVLDLIKLLHENNIILSVVTNSPRPYCKAILDHWNFNINNLVCYHDVKERKPNSEPIVKAIDLMIEESRGLYPEEEHSLNQIISVGDDRNDIIPSNECGLVSIASMWDSDCSQEEMLLVKPTHTCDSIDDLYELLKEIKFI